MKTIVIIPSRMAAMRLPGKPLHGIFGKPLVGHVIDQTKKTFGGKVAVAYCDDSLLPTIQSFGAEPIWTDPAIPSGSDRVYRAFESLQNQTGESFDLIVNLQGDMVYFEEDLIEKTLAVFHHLPDTDVATAVCPMDKEDILNPSFVKAAFEPLDHAPTFGRTLYFSRAPISHDAPQYYKHIGIYAYKREALKAFIDAPVTKIEKIENLEQLRGIAIGQRYSAALVQGTFLSIDTPDDARIAEEFLKTHG